MLGDVRDVLGWKARVADGWPGPGLEVASRRKSRRHEATLQRLQAAFVRWSGASGAEPSSPTSAERESNLPGELAAQSCECLVRALRLVSNSAAQLQKVSEAQLRPHSSCVQNHPNTKELIEN